MYQNTITMKGNKSVELKPNGENSLATLIGLAIPPTLPGELTFLFVLPLYSIDLRGSEDGLFKPFLRLHSYHLSTKNLTSSLQNIINKHVVSVNSKENARVVNQRGVNN